MLNKTQIRSLSSSARRLVDDSRWHETPAQARTFAAAIRDADRAVPGCVGQGVLDTATEILRRDPRDVDQFTARYDYSATKCARALLELERVHFGEPTLAEDLTAGRAIAVAIAAGHRAATPEIVRGLAYLARCVSRSRPGSIEPRSYDLVCDAERTGEISHGAAVARVLVQLERWFGTEAESRVQSAKNNPHGEATRRAKGMTREAWDRACEQLRYA